MSFKTNSFNPTISRDGETLSRDPTTLTQREGTADVPTVADSSTSHDDAGNESLDRRPSRDLESQFESVLETMRCHAGSIKRLETTLKEEAGDSPVSAEAAVDTETGQLLVRTIQALFDEYISWQDLCKDVPEQDAGLIEQFHPKDIIEEAGLNEQLAIEHSQRMRSGNIVMVASPYSQAVYMRWGNR